jgi:apolipoprotein N-acyltransferase
MEFPPEAEVLPTLDRLLRNNPTAALLMLSEYTFDGPIPEKVKSWCRLHRRYLVVGGKDPAPRGNYYNTAFVIGPDGEIIFRQIKSVPIQFFKDGLPAATQALWDSPWGKIGICICYDLSYTRVTDELIRQGAQAILVPTMDVADWGLHQHELHARVAPIRAAEYGVPVFRVASSGISQFVDERGRVRAQAGFPGEQEEVSALLTVSRPGSLPWDRWLAPFAFAATALVIAWMLVQRAFRIQGRGGN